MIGLDPKGKTATRINISTQQVSGITHAPIYLIDERLTTVAANRTLREAGLNSRTAKSEIDSMAATAILESALNQERIQGEPMNRFQG